MSTVIEDLVALVGYELAPGSEANVEAFVKGVDIIAERIENLGVLAIKGAALVATYGVAFAGVSTYIAKSTDSLVKLADTIAGVSFERLQGLTFAQQFFGGDQDDVVSGIDAIQERMAEFRRGEGDFRLFGEVGVSFGGNVNDVIERLANRFEGLSTLQSQDLGERLGLSREFVTLLQQGADGIDALTMEAEGLGAIIGRDAAENSVKYNQSLFRATSLIDGIVTSVSTGLLPVMTKGIDRFLVFVEANKDLIEAGLEDFLDISISLITTLADLVLYLAERFVELVDFVGGTKNAVYLLGIAFVVFQLTAAAAMAGVTLTLKGVGLAAIAAAAKVLLIPLLIATAIAAALIILEDIFAFLQGKESAIGLIAGEFTAWLEPLREANRLLDLTLTAFGKIVGFAGKLNLIEAAKGAGETVGAVAESVRGGTVKADAEGIAQRQIAGVYNFIRGSLGIGSGESIGSRFGFGGDVAIEPVPGGNLAKYTDTPAGIGVGGGSGGPVSINQTNNVKIDINGSGLPATELATTVEGAIMSGTALPSGVVQ